MISLPTRSASSKSHSLQNQVNIVTGFESSVDLQCSVLKNFLEWRIKGMFVFFIYFFFQV